MSLAPSPRTAVLERRQRRRGRPSAFTEATRNMVLGAVRRGNYPSVAANLAGIHYATLKDWLDKGYSYSQGEEEGMRLTAEERVFAKFYRDYVRTEAQHESDVLEGAEDLARDQKQWAGLMTILERRYGSRWRRQDSMEHVGPGGGPVVVKELDSSRERLTGVIAILADRGILARLIESQTPGIGGTGPVIDAKAEPVHNGEAQGGSEQTAAD